MKTSGLLFLFLAGVIWLAVHRKLDPLARAIVRGKS